MESLTLKTKAKDRKIDCTSFENRGEAWKAMDMFRSSLMSRSLQFQIQHTVKEDGSFEFKVSGNGRDVGENEQSGGQSDEKPTASQSGNTGKQGNKTKA